MKVTYILRLTKEHRDSIKFKAFQRGKTMNDFILESVNLALNQEIVEIEENTKPITATQVLIECGSEMTKPKKDKECKLCKCKGSGYNEKEDTWCFCKHHLKPLRLRIKAQNSDVNCQKCLYPLKAVPHTCKK